MPQLQELPPKIVAGTALRGCQTIRGRTERKLQANSRARSVPVRRDDRIRRRQLSLQRFPRDDLAEFGIRGVSTCDAFAEPWYNVSAPMPGDIMTALMHNGDIKRGIVLSGNKTSCEEANELVLVTSGEGLVTTCGKGALRLPLPTKPSLEMMPHLSKDSKIAKSLLGRKVLLPVDSLHLNKQCEVVALPAATPILPKGWSAHVDKTFRDLSVIISGVEGEFSADIANGVYRPTGETYNDRTLFRKESDSDKWLLYGPTNKWTVTDTAYKNAKQSKGWLVSLEAGLAHPTQATCWSVATNGKYQEETSVTVTPLPTSSTCIASSRTFYHHAASGRSQYEFPVAVAEDLQPGIYKYKCMSDVKYLSKADIMSTIDEKVSIGQLVIGGLVPGKETILKLQGQSKYLPLVLDGKLLFERIIPLPSTFVDGWSENTLLVGPNKMEDNDETCRFWKEDPSALINERIRILWKHGKRYDGTVSMYDPSDNLYRIDYDDGEKKWYSLDTKTFWLKRDNYARKFSSSEKLKCSEEVENSRVSTHGGFFDIKNKSEKVMEIVSLDAGHKEGGKKGESNLYVRKSGPSRFHEMKPDGWEQIWTGNLDKNKSTNVSLEHPVTIQPGAAVGFYLHATQKGIRLNNGGAFSGAHDDNMSIIPGNYHEEAIPFHNVQNQTKYTIAGSVTYRLQEPLENSSKKVKKELSKTKSKIKSNLVSGSPSPGGILRLPEGIWISSDGLAFDYDKSKWQLGMVTDYNSDASNGCNYKVSFSQECLELGLQVEPRSCDFSRLNFTVFSSDGHSGTSYLSNNIQPRAGEGIAKGNLVMLADDIGTTKNLKPGEVARVTYGPDSDGDFKVTRVSDGAELRYFKKMQLKLAYIANYNSTPRGKAPEHEIIHFAPFTSQRARWITFEAADNVDDQSPSSKIYSAARFMKALIGMQSVWRSQFARAVIVPARKSEIHNEMLNKTLGRTALHLQAMWRGRIARWALLPNRRKELRDYIVEVRKKEVSETEEKRRAMTTLACTEMLKQLPKEAKELMNFEALVNLKMDIDYNVVGLDVIKDWANGFLKECLMYLSVLGERNETRHILLSGAMGTGKRHAAKLIAKTLYATGHVQSEELKNGGASTGKVLYTTASAVKESWVGEYGGVTIISSRSKKALAQSVGGMESFIKKREPTRLDLPCLSLSELAEISLRKLAAETVVPVSVTRDLLMEMINHKWSDGEQRHRGIYLVEDILRYLKAAETRSIGKRLLLQQDNWSQRRRNGFDEEKAIEAESDIDHTVRSRLRLHTNVGGGILYPEYFGLPTSVMQRLRQEQMQQQQSSDTDMEAHGEEAEFSEVGKQASEDEVTEMAEIAAARARVDQEIEELIGMGSAKRWFKEMRAKILYVERGGNSKILSNLCLNMCLTGNPGTGKTTLARLMFKFLRNYGILKRDVFIEMNALELKGKYVGWTTPLVQNTFRSALGGALFLDEAYSLAGDGTKQDTFSGEAIRTLLTEIENNRTSVMVIVAGYRDKMANFFRADPGLSRRFPSSLHLPDYSPEEVAQIAISRAALHYEMTVAKGVEERLVEALKTRWNNDIKTMNAGLAVKLTEEAVGRLATRLSNETIQGQQTDSSEMKASFSSDHKNESFSTLIDADFDLDDRLETDSYSGNNEEMKSDDGDGSNDLHEKQRLARERAQARKEALDALEQMQGMEAAKAFLRKILLKVKLVEKGASRALLNTCTNIVITGNPGVGKTTFARICHRVLHTHGVLREDIFVEKNALELKGAYVGHTTPNVLNAIAAAKGGTLFLDEFPALASTSSSLSGSARDSFANDAVRTLLTEIENNRCGICVILAGYAKPMETALDADPGLRRRFPHRLHLPDYKPEVLAKIGTAYARSQFDLHLGRGVEAFLAKQIATNHQNEMSQQNASLPIRLVELAIERMAERVLEGNKSKIEILEISDSDDVNSDDGNTDEELLDTSNSSVEREKDETLIFKTLECEDFTHPSLCPTA